MDCIVTMCETLSLTVQWVGGVALFVKVNRLDPVKSALDLCRQSQKIGATTRLIHNGRILNPGLSFAFQNVKDGDLIVVYEAKQDQRATKALDVLFEENVLSVMHEVMRINDWSFKGIEQNRGAARLYQQLYAEDEIERCEEPEETDTTVVANADRISCEPLPQLAETDHDEDEDDDNMRMLPFDTIEEAGKYFSKHPLSEWIW